MGNTALASERQRPLPRSALDPDALSAVEHLQRSGFTAYFVGGCVRDLILRRRPKDFDIVTDATPSQLKRLFRNCRLIGRRFRLAHLYYGSKIIEAATFRGMGASDGQSRVEDAESIERTNTFGSPLEDARSRDFTVNGLFYDPMGGRLIDFVSGYEDLQHNRLRTIGEPDVRFAEDPVRILRAVKFAARLGFDLDPALRGAMARQAALIMTCPPPRVTEEIFRLAESNHLEKSVSVMREMDVLVHVLPEIDAHLQRADAAEHYSRLVKALDHMGRAHGGLPRDFLLTALYYPLIVEGASGNGSSWGDYSEEWFQPIGVRMHMPIRLRSRMSSILAMFEMLLATSPVARRKKTRAILQSPATPQALSLLRLHYMITGEGATSYREWQQAAQGEGTPVAPTAHVPDGDSPPAADDGRVRSRGRRRRR